MTSLWRICFSLLALLPMYGGTVTGRVELTSSRDPGVRERHDFSSVVVWLEPLSPGAPAPKPMQHVEMVQKDKTFTPHVLAITAGTAVEFPNFDPIFHNAFSSFSGQVFDVGLYPPGSSKSVVFRREGIVRVFCNIHSAMSAIIVVLRTPYFAVTPANGQFEINAPAGDYRLHVFHERATQETLHALERTVKVDDERENLGTISISETGYLPSPHLNKFGHKYQTAPDGRSVYPGAKK